jgi:hypothetical protein
MEKVFKLSELLEEGDPTGEMAARLLEDSKLSNQNEIIDLIVGENSKYFFRSNGIALHLFDFIYFYQFRNWREIIDNFTCALVAKNKPLEKEKFEEIEKIPHHFQSYICENSCINKSKSCNTINEAVEMGHLCCLKKFYVPSFGDLLNIAANVGNLKILKYLHSKGYPMDRWLLPNAIMFGDIEIVKWLIQNGAPLTQLTFECATKAVVEGKFTIHPPSTPNDPSGDPPGHEIDLLDILKEKNCPYNANIFNPFLVEKGDAERKTKVLNWLKKNGYILK